MATRAQIKESGLEHDLRTLRDAVRILRRRGQPSLARITAKEADDVEAELAEFRAGGTRLDNGRDRPPER